MRRCRASQSRSGQSARQHAHEGGAVSAELVIVTPVLLLLVMLVVQFALWQHAQHIAEASAQRGSEAARVVGGTDAAGNAAARDAAAQLGSGVLGAPTITVARSGNVVHVDVSGTAVSVVPFLFLPVHASVEAPVERFTAP